MDNAASQRAEGKDMRQGTMHIGPEGTAHLEAAWADIAKSGASQVL